MEKIQDYFAHLGWNSASNESKKTFIGVILVKFGTGSSIIWGIISIYFFSYYKHLDDTLKMSQFSLIVTIAAIPMGILAIFSIQIAEFIGFKKIIRLGMIINPLCLMVGSLQQNFYMFATLYILQISFCFGSTMMPVLYCLWSHFPKKIGNVTGIALTSFGLASFTYSIIATKIVNPDNIPARIKYTEGSQLNDYY